MVTSTANWIAAVRARETRRHDRLFADPLAEALAGEHGAAMMARSEQASGGENRFIPVRVRWFDDATAAATAAGIRQVVLLGAGLDTRPYRLDLPADVDWYELDRPEILAHKDPVLATTVPHCRRHTVAADLAGDWGTPLRASGFDSTRCTLWLAEGLFFYLAEESVLGLLRQTATLCPPDSLFLADVMGAAGLHAPAMRAYRDHCVRNNLPLPFGSDDPATLFTTGGWAPERITAAGAPDANYGRLPEIGSGPHPGWPHLVTARLAQADR
ncbi:SAM-dependent methyltransferase [Actinopolymorpha pittospori]|uniref:S-adenosyl-L-methionine-dependent methyltransferase n=1 Tax=Actinopolymorpha pittospori TaxID=648752 RepID=A0A927N4S7_9ACTN|nr:methyltransferase (TIGR00027 family) [Actinopolymorpha pittospori]